MARNKRTSSRKNDEHSSACSLLDLSKDVKRSRIDVAINNNKSNLKKELIPSAGIPAPFTTVNAVEKKQNIMHSQSPNNNLNAPKRFLCQTSRIHVKHSRLTDPDIVLQQKYALLDCLTTRKRKLNLSSSIKSKQIKKLNNGRCVNAESTNIDYICSRIETPNTSNRSKCRTFLEKSFTQGIQMSGVDLHEPNLIAYPALLACELEAEIYKQYPDDKREYQAKIRSLRYNLENVKNPTLCSRVLLQELALIDLVNMSPGQLASKQIQDERARAEKEALREVVLTVGNDTAKKDKAFHGQTISTKFSSVFPDSMKVKIQPFAVKNRNKQLNVIKGVEITKRIFKTPRLLQSAVKGKQANAAIAVFSGKSNLNDDKNVGDNMNSGTKSAGGNNVSVSSNINKDIHFERGKIPVISSVFPSRQQFGAPNSESPQSNSPTIPRTATPYNSRMPEINMASIEQQTGRYSPPPSPAYSVMSAAHSTSGVSVLPINIVKLKNGGEKITFEIKNVARFETRLAIDVRTLYALNNFLPRHLNDKGSIKIEVFDNFLMDKIMTSKNLDKTMKRTNWKIIPLRLSLSQTTIENQADYKKFYKNYESEKKILMCQVSTNTKLFLVTPKYLRLKCLKNLISKKDRTHAIIMTKENLSTCTENEGSKFKSRNSFSDSYITVPQTTDTSVTSSVWGSVPQAKSGSPSDKNASLGSLCGRAIIQSKSMATYTNSSSLAASNGCGSHEFSPEPDMMVNEDSQGSSERVSSSTCGSRHQSNEGQWHHQNHPRSNYDNDTNKNRQTSDPRSFSSDWNTNKAVNDDTLIKDKHERSSTSVWRHGRNTWIQNAPVQNYENKFNQSFSNSNATDMNENSSRKLEQERNTTKASSGWSNIQTNDRVWQNNTSKSQNESSLKYENDNSKQSSSNNQFPIGMGESNVQLTDSTWGNSKSSKDWGSGWGNRGASGWN